MGAVFLRPVFVKPDSSKVKYKDIAGVMTGYGKFGNSPIVTKIVKFGWRRPLVIIAVLAFILSAMTAHSFLFFIIGGIISACLLSIPYWIVYGICISFAYRYGSKDMQKWIKNDEVAPVTKWRVTATNKPGEDARLRATYKTRYGDIGFGGPLVPTLLFARQFFHKTKPEEVVRKARQESQRNAQNSYKTRQRGRLRPTNEEAHTRKSKKAV